MSVFKRHSATTTTTAAALAAMVAVLVQRCGAMHGRGVAETSRRDSAARFAAAAANVGRENAGLEEFEPEKTLPTAAKLWPPIDVDGAGRESRASDVSLVIKKIYENMSEYNRHPGGSGDRLDGFDVVRALEDNSGGGERLHYHFDTSSVEASQETLTRAEFYVFIRAPRSGQVTTSILPSIIKLSLYRVLDERRLRIDNATADGPSPEAVSLLATRRVLASHRDEVDFRGSIALRDTVKEWIARPRTNKGLLLTVTDGDRRRAGGQLDNGADLLVAGGSSGEGRGLWSAGRQPVLIIYTKTKSQSVDTIGTPPQQRVIREVDRLAGGHSHEASLCKGRARAASVQSNGCAERDDGSGWDDGSEQPGGRRSPLPIFGRRARTLPRRNLATAGESSSAFGASSAAARSPSSSDELATSDGSMASFGSGGGEDESPQHLPQWPAAGRRRFPPTPSRQRRPPEEETTEADGFAADITSSPPVRSSGSCRPQSFNISFEELNYPVIAPKTLQVGLCAGRCKLAPSDLNRLNLTNHAKLLAMARFLNPSRAKLAKACCVPGELTKASLLYSDEDGIVTMRNYDNMVVKSCTCR